MFSKSQFLDSVAHEVAVCKHLFTCIPDGGLEYRPGPKMRDTLELLRYLTLCGQVPAWAMVNDTWDRAGERLAEVAEMPAEQFPRAMDDQLRAMREILSALTGQDLFERRVKLPWGAEMPLGEALVNTSLKFLTAYRMQLFAHAKAAGASELDTSDCWLGRKSE